jgi:hypothetical protein
MVSSSDSAAQHSTAQTVTLRTGPHSKARSTAHSTAPISFLTSVGPSSLVPRPSSLVPHNVSLIRYFSRALIPAVRRLTPASPPHRMHARLPPMAPEPPGRLGRPERPPAAASPKMLCRCCRSLPAQSRLLPSLARLLALCFPLCASRSDGAQRWSSLPKVANRESSPPPPLSSHRYPCPPSVLHPLNSLFPLPGLPTN